MSQQLRPRRSVLFMPGANQRALAKARTLSADAIILDLEDAVAPDAKHIARANVVAAVRAGGYGAREVNVRINPLNSAWGQDDLDAIATLPIDGLVLPKVESVEMVNELSDALRSRGQSLPIWAMMETPIAILRVADIALHAPGLGCLLMGTSDLSKDLRLPPETPVAGLMWSLSQCVVAARAAGLDIIDGVHLDLADDAGFRAACQRANALGFDGKSLIHPTQIAMSNATFGQTPAQIALAQRVVDAYTQALRQGAGIAVLDGKLVENLHVEQAQRTIALAQATAALGFD